MPSVYERVLGDRMNELDPRLRAYFDELPEGLVGRGSGVYGIAGSRHRWLAPALAWLAWRGVLFPEFGRDVPFEVENRDAGGARSARRTFSFPRRTRTMVDAMRVVDGAIRDRLGRRGGLEVELRVAVRDGALHMSSGRQWLRLGPMRLRLPGVVRVELTEHAGAEGQRVDVRMTAPLLGEVFRYAGTFTYEIGP